MAYAHIPISCPWNFVSVKFEGTDKEYTYRMDRYLIKYAKEYPNQYFCIKNDSGYNYRDSRIKFVNYDKQVERPERPEAAYQIPWYEDYKRLTAIRLSDKTHWITPSKAQIELEILDNAAKDCAKLNTSVRTSDNWHCDSLASDSSCVAISEDGWDTVTVDTNGITCKRLNSNNKTKKEKPPMNKMFNFKFGPVETGLIKLSPYGLAIQNDDDKYVTYDKVQKKIIDVDILNFSLDKMIYYMPTAIKDITPGDIIMHNTMPMVITETPTNKTNLVVVDVCSGEIKNILPTTSPFGFNFVTKIVSLIDLSNLNADANTDNPFGSLLPMMLMGDNDSEFDMKSFAMMSIMSGGSIDMSNPMMMMALMGGDNDNSMMPLLMMNMMNTAKATPVTPAAE